VRFFYSDSSKGTAVTQATLTFSSFSKTAGVLAEETNLTFLADGKPIMLREPSSHQLHPPRFPGSRGHLSGLEFQQL